MIRRRSFLLSSVVLPAYCLIARSAFGAALSADQNAPPVRNTITLHNASGDDARDYPLRIGRPFVLGEIAGIPQAVIGGMRIPTQADVKARWPDGSVKHAILSLVIPRIPSGGRVDVSFVDQPIAQNASLTREQMLDRGFDFDAVIALARDGRAESVSARSMLEDGHFAVWCQGQIATTIVIADHSAQRKYDFGFEAARPVRPIFHATFWPALRKVHVRVIGENICTETLQDVAYGLTLKAGLGSPVEVFHQDMVPHYAATRWTRSFWIGGAPETLIDIDHNLGYIGKSRAFPTYAPLVLDPRVVVQDYARAQTGVLPAKLYENGGLAGWMIDQGTAGGRDDIGHHTAQVTKWLYTGDHRYFDIVSKLADMAGAWPLHYREGNPAKKFDKAGTVTAIGLPVSVYAHPGDLLAPPKEPRILIDPARPMMLNGGWRPNPAHLPDPYSALYLLTGDYFYLEQEQLWGATITMYPTLNVRGYGMGCFLDEARGMAWGIRTRVNAAELSPDGSPEKAYFNAMVNDALAFFEGRLGIKGTKFEGTPAYIHGANNWPFRHPLHFWIEQGWSNGVSVDPATVSMITAPWQHSMIISELGIAKEKGYPADALLTYTSRVISAQFEEPDTYDWHNVQRYWAPSSDKSGKHYSTWTEVLAGYQTPNQPWGSGGAGDGYASYACAASTFIRGEPGGERAYQVLKANYFDGMTTKQSYETYLEEPRWAFVARS